MADAAPDVCAACMGENRADGRMACCKRSLCLPCYAGLADSVRDLGRRDRPKKRCPFCDAVNDAGTSLPSLVVQNRMPHDVAVRAAECARHVERALSTLRFSP